jgi:hypothetical protein
MCHRSKKYALKIKDIFKSTHDYMKYSPKGIGTLKIK